MNLNVEPSEAPVAEVTLDQSSYDSSPMQFVIDHHFLLNALSFGFREFHLQGSNFPIFCTGRNQGYVWAAIHESLTIGSTPNMRVFSSTNSLVAA
jgi:hypothetical protein